MSEQTVSNNLKYLIKLHDGISILELSKKTRIPQPTLHHILNGQTKKPRKQALEALATYFSISVEQLTGVSQLPKIPNALKENLKISTVQVIEWDMICDKKRVPIKEIILDKQIGETSFALIMNNSSMEPLFPENSLLIFDSEKKPRDRDFVIASIHHNNKILFNRLFIDGSDFFIKHTIDDETTLLRLNIPPDKIIATLIEVRLQF